MDKTIIKKVKKVLPRVLIILGGIILIFVILFGGIKANDYWQVNKLVKASDSLLKQEKYQEAYNSLTLTQTRWTISKVKKEIETKMIVEKQLIADADNYAKANDLFGQSKWQEAKDSYSKISDKFQHYKEAQDKIKECQSKIDEANTQAEEQKAREAQAQRAKQASTPKTVTNTAADDPFPSIPDYNQCPNANAGKTVAEMDFGAITIEEIQCRANLKNKYQNDLASWYARHR